MPHPLFHSSVETQHAASLKAPPGKTSRVRRTPSFILLLKLVLWILCLCPVSLLAWKATHDQLGANPLSEVTLSTGHWTLYLLLITLAVSPLRKITGLNWLIRFRRPLGLFAFFYGCLHLMTYLWFDKFFDVHEIVKDIYKRPFITAGMTAWLLMFPLALTSTAASIRWLGGKRWQMLHRLIYASATAGVVHFWWLVKRDLTRPERMAAILVVLLGFRLLLSFRVRRGGRGIPTVPAPSRVYRDSSSAAALGMTEQKKPH